MRAGLNIAGVKLLLELPAAGFVDEMLRYFGPFLSELATEAADLTLTAELVTDLRTELAADEQVLPAADWTTRGFQVRGPNFELRVEGASKAASLRQAPGRFPLETAIKMVLAEVLSQRGGFLVHGVALAKEGRAALFSGQSGAGKSTLGRVASEDPGGGVQRLADELVAVIPVGNGRYHCHGTPWNLGTPGEAELRMLGRLAFTARPVLSTASAAELLRLLLPNTLLVNGTAEGRGERFRALAALVAAVPVVELGFAPDPEAGRFLASHLQTL